MGLTAAKLISLLEQAIVVADDPLKKKAVLAEVFAPMGFGADAELDPGNFLSAEQTKTILRGLIKLSAAEKKASYDQRVTLRDARIVALEKISVWADGAPRISPVFSSVDRYDVAVQMALRVRRPSSMNQGPQGFCGPASVVVPWLRDNPSAYVDFVTGLFESGLAQLGGRAVDVRGAGAFLKAWHAGCGPAADYIALGSLRADVEMIVDSLSGGGTVFSFFQPESHATTPQQIAKLLEQAGYGNVQNRVLTDYTAPRDKTGLVAAGISLGNCANVLSSNPGSVVIMLVNGVLAKNAKRQTAIAGNAHVARLADLHWILVRRMTATGLYINPPELVGTVSMKLYTWKWSGLADFSLGDFLPRYFGYISAEPA